MTLEIRYTSAYRRDFKKSKKPKKDDEKLQEVLEQLVSRKPLPEQNHDHDLSGNWAGFRECHVTPDWLLIYRVKRKTLTLVRLGSHSELFR